MKTSSGRRAFTCQLHLLYLFQIAEVFCSLAAEAPGSGCPFCSHCARFPIETPDMWIAGLAKSETPSGSCKPSGMKGRAAEVPQKTGCGNSHREIIREESDRIASPAQATAPRSWPSRTSGAASRSAPRRRHSHNSK